MNEWVWSNGGMVLTGENWSIGRKTLYSVGGRWMNEYGAMVEWYWQGKTEVLGQKTLYSVVVDEWIWSNGGMILTGINCSTRRKACPISTLSTRKPKWTDLVLNPFLRCERSATDRLNLQFANPVARSVHLTFLMHFNSHTFAVFCLSQPNYATVRIKLKPLPH